MVQDTSPQRFNRIIRRTITEHHESGVDVTFTERYPANCLYKILEGRFPTSFAFNLLDKHTPKDLNILKELLHICIGRETSKDKGLVDLEHRLECKFTLTSEEARRIGIRLRRRAEEAAKAGDPNYTTTPEMIDYLDGLSKED